MSGCRSCPGRTPEACSKPIGKAEKLQKEPRSDNPRYPHVFVGKQAIYADDQVQMIVTVVSDDCDETCDHFTLEPQLILKGSTNGDSERDPFEVSQAAGETCWKLRALI